ncbi:isoprenylcysteine carboxylmethyltransferase family protein [Nostoc sp. FACHB-280]|uniref:methyltransferase family protein n=1 Tax=Nostoc sp. FACHB-280 TaxID=2692839 RepID=UPI00168AEA79|nr:isoprenylcysteine carboxylmethyltransferase family protein [Nostoc sp. FACHB-280]MBD2498849.1 isoprenylcysteine carboxylmethyltransferase family protein [Nostoc sp. FACHB-280]
MTSKAVLAYLLIAGYFVMERLLRQVDKGLSLQAGEFDRGSSKVIWISGLLGIVLIVFAPILNANQIGDWDNGYFGWLGLLIMLSGLVLRYWAAKTLGEFYTRTLQTSEQQQIIQQAPYNIIRHPGYLGTFLMEIGACLAIANWIILIVIAVTGVLVRGYRIQIEEEMLKTVFSEQYTLYSQKTWRLIPFIY